MAINKLFWNSFTKNLAIVLVAIIVVRGIVQEFFKRGDEYGSGYIIPIAGEPTISQKDSELLADQLADSFSGGFLGIGTNDKLLESILDRLTPQDFALVHNSFGLREYDGYSVNNDSSWFLPKTSKKRSLIYILDKELQSYDVRIRRKVSSLYSKIGLNFVV